jgi:hypothetical protein
VTGWFHRTLEREDLATELYTDERPPFLPKPLFDRETVSFRPVVLDAAGDVARSLKPMFHALWQAAGEDRSLG